MNSIGSFEAISVAISAIVAVVALIFTLVSARNRRHEDELRVWQRVAVHSFLEKKGVSGAAINEMLQWYRSEASAYLHVVSKKDLSETALRRVLIELISSHAIEAMGDGKYRLNSPESSRDLMNDEVVPGLASMLKPIMSSMASITFSKAIYAQIAAAPNTLTIADISINVSEESGVPTEEIRGFIAQEMARGRLIQSEDGKLKIGNFAAL